MTEQYYDENGCTPDCPIRLLSEQSGYSKSDAHIRHNTHTNSADKGWGFKAHETTGIIDEGGASRYFTQLAPDNEVA